MGPLVTINSATLVNKGLEVIEAHLLFGIPFDRIEVVVHPTSVVHSMVEFVDGSTLVQASPPTMLIPIALGLDWPDRVPDAAPGGRLDARRDLGVLPARRRGVPGRRAGPRGRASAAAPPRRSTTPPTRCASRSSSPAGCGSPTSCPRSPASSPDHDVPSEGELTVDDVLAADAWARARAHELIGKDRMTALFYTLGVVVFVVAILASIGLHELGHMIPAKKFGGKVTQYFIGFGPTVWSKQRGETEYGIKAIPLGGYVKIVGMLPAGAEELDEDREHPVYDEDGNRVVRVRKSNTGMFTQLISDARAAEWEHIRPEDSDRLFYKMAVVEEGHRDGRRADGEHPDRVLHLPGVFATLRPAHASSRRPGSRSSTRSPTAWCQPPRTAAPAPPRTRSPRPRTPASSTGDTILVVQRHRGDRLEPAPETDPRERRRPGGDRRRARRREGHRHDQHDW